MALLPLYLEMQDAPCLVIGGGRVARRKIASLLETGAVIDVIAPDLDPAIEALAAQQPQRLRLHRRGYRPQSLTAYMLVIAATDDPAINRQVFDDAQRDRVWVNVVDVPELCTVQAAALMRRGPIQIAFNSGGECPALSAALRNEVEKSCSEWIADYARALGEARRWLIAHCDDIHQRKAVLNHFAEKDIREGFSGIPLEALGPRLIAAVADFLDKPA